MLLPREHGVYGQCAIPILTAFVVAGISLPNALVAGTVVAAFLAHEPAAVLLGSRGARADATQRKPAAAWLLVWVAAAAACGLTALARRPADVRWSLLVPAIPAAVLVRLTLLKREKSWYGEVASALAFAGAAVPIIVANGEPLATGVAIAVPFATLFVAGTLAVRAVILSVRAGGDMQAARRIRWSLSVLWVAATILMVWSARTGLMPHGALVAILPGLGLSALIAMRPPAPSHLRAVGWSLVAASILTAALAATAVS
jgi:hypothetical protein